MARDSRNKTLPGMETPVDEELEEASRTYRKTIARRLKVQKDEATQKAKVAELVLAWAERNKIKPTLEENDNGADIEVYTYTRDDIIATADRPLKWNVHVKIGGEVKASESSVDPAEGAS